MRFKYLRENSQYVININLQDGDKVTSTLSEFLKSDTFKEYNSYAYENAIQFSDEALNKYGVWKTQHGGVSLEKLGSAFENLSINSYMEMYMQVFEGTLKPLVFKTFFDNCMEKVLNTIDELFTDKDPMIVDFLKSRTRNNAIQWKAVKIVLMATFRSPFRRMLNALDIDFFDKTVSPFTLQIKKISIKMFNEFEKFLIRYNIIKNEDDYITKKDLNDLIEILSGMEFKINDFVNKNGIAN